MKKIWIGISRLFEANPAGIALLLIARRSWNGLTSSVMSLFLRAPSLHLGPGCRVIGGRRVSFGRNIYAERNLWLEAVTSYREQRFHPQITIGDRVCFSDGVHISSIESVMLAVTVFSAAGNTFPTTIMGYMGIVLDVGSGGSQRSVEYHIGG